MWKRHLMMLCMISRKGSEREWERGREREELKESEKSFLWCDSFFLLLSSTSCFFIIIILMMLITIQRFPHSYYPSDGNDCSWNFWAESGWWWSLWWFFFTWFRSERKDVPQVKIVLGAKIDKESIREGTDVYFECIISAHPWVTEVMWFFEGTPLFSDPSSGIIISNQSLVLQKVKRTSRGRFWCSAINSEGRGESDEFYLRVLCKYTFPVHPHPDDHNHPSEHSTSVYF